MQLRRVVNCLKLLNWETQLPDGCPAEQWLSRLRQRGGQPLNSRIGGLEKIAYRGHEVLLVTRSGRVNIRIAYTTPHLQRRLAAEEVFVWLVAGVRHADS